MDAIEEREMAAAEPLPAALRPGADGAVVTITAGRPVYLAFRELWEFRELLYFLTWRDIKVRYKQTMIGAGWAVIQPVVAMVVFATIFGRFARMPSEGIPYPVFAYTGLLPWQLFAGGMQRSIASLVSSAPLITKVYFPRLLVPIAATFSATVDFFIAFLVLIAMALGFGLTPTWRIAAMPGFLALVVLAALGVGLWLSALNVRFRDVGHAVPFLVQMWMFASPVVYPASLVPERWRLLYALNPMVGAIEGFRWALLDKPAPPAVLVAVSAAVAFVLVLSGLAFFRRMERTFADVI
jgi:lipopolysaccharide transport system permease protein